MRNSKGFTIVELLIVVVVIAILAAVTTIAYNGVQRNAIEATLKTDAQQGATTIAAVNAESGEYPLDLSQSGFKVSKGNDYQYSSDTKEFCLTVISPKMGGISYYVKNNGPVTKGSCPNHNSGGLTAANTWKDVSVGSSHSCGITRDDKAYCWGWNLYGQLGLNSSANEMIATPTPVYMGGALSGKTLLKIEAGSTSTCALASDYKVYCWGYSYYAGIGTSGGVFIGAPTPIDTTNIPSTYHATDISMSEFNRACLVADGRVYCWGANTNGSLGDGTTETRLLPVPVSNDGGIGGKTVTKVSVGYQNTCAIADNGVYCWGSGRGNANSGNTTKRYIPYPVGESVFNGKAIQDIMSANAASCAIADYKVYCWGEESLVGSTDTPSSGTITTPTLVSNQNTGDYRAVAVSGESVGHCFLTETSTLYCSARDAVFPDEVTGNPEIINSYIPVSVSTPAVSGFEYVSIGKGAGCAIANDGRLYCWGRDTYGRLGVNPTPTASGVRYLAPTLVLNP